MGALASAYVTNLIKLPWLQSSHFHTAYRLHRKSESKTEVTVWDPWTAHYLTVCHTPSLTSVCLWAWCVCVGCANCRSTRNVFRCTLARKFWTVTMMNVTCTLFSHHLTWVTCEVCAVLSCNYCCFFFFPKCTTVHLSVTAGKHTVACAYLNTVRAHQHLYSLHTGNTT